MIDPDRLDQVLGAWLWTRVVQVSGGLVIAVDGKAVRGAKDKGQRLCRVPVVRGVRAGGEFAGCLLAAGRVAGRVVRARESHRLHSLWRLKPRRRKTVAVDASIAYFPPRGGRRAPGAEMLRTRCSAGCASTRSR